MKAKLLVSLEISHNYLVYLEIIHIHTYKRNKYKNIKLMKPIVLAKVLHNPINVR